MLLDLAESGLDTLLSVSDDSETGVSGGTGFVVSSSGHVLTNAHVVDECASVTAKVDGEGLALTLIATDYANDLAVLRLPDPLDNVATFRDHDARLAESILVFGYPLQSLLSSTIHVTAGLVSNLGAMYDNTSSFQISAPVQAGNSGSPVLDQSGNVLGVVEGGLDPPEMLDEMGELPQNVNFAIKTSVVLGGELRSVPVGSERDQARGRGDRG